MFESQKRPYPLPPNEPHEPLGFSERIRNSFSALQAISSENPNLVALQKYGATIDSSLSRLAYPLHMTRAEASRLLANISPSERKDGFCEVIGTLAHNTHYLDELKDSRVVSGLQSGDLTHGDYGAHVVFLDRKSRLSNFMHERGREATYVPDFDTAFIYQKPETIEQMWTELATQGTLPESVALLDNMLTKDAQYSALKRAIIWSPRLAGTIATKFIQIQFGIRSQFIFQVTGIYPAEKIRQYLGNDPILSDIHGAEAAASSPTAESIQSNPQDIVSYVMQYHLATPDNVEAAHRAFLLVHNLRLLGLNDREIGKLVEKAGYDRNKNTYPALEKAVEKKFRDWGVTSEDEKKAVLDALQAKHDIEVQLEREKAKKIAQKGLRRASGGIESFLT